MARRRSAIQKFIELVFDRNAGDRAERDTQRSLRRGTDPRRAKQNLSAVEQGMESLRKTAQRIGAAVAAYFAFNQIRQFFSSAFSASLDAEKAATRLRGVWEANAGAVGRTFEQIQKFGREIRDTTLFRNEEIDLAMSQLLTYKSIQADVFEDTLRVAADISAVFENSLPNATQALAKALDDPIRGLGDLRKAGFTFEDGVIRQITALTEQNRLFEAQRLILDTLASEQGGVAQKMRTGWTGAVKGFSDAWDDLKEAVGRTLMTASGGPSIMDRITGAIKRLSTWIDDNAKRFEDWGGKVSSVFSGVLGKVKEIDAILGENRRQRFAEQWRGHGVTGVWSPTAAPPEGASPGPVRPAPITTLETEEERKARQKAAEEYSKKVIADADMLMKQTVRDLEEHFENNPVAVEVPIEFLPIDHLALESARLGAIAFDQERLNERAREWADEWRDIMSEVEAATLAVAYGVANTWKDAFLQMREEGANLGTFLETVARGMGAAMLGGLAQYASGKIAENVAMAFEALAKAKAYAFTPGLQGFAPGQMSAVKDHLVAAAKWGLLAGAAGAAQSMSAGGGGSGLAGGIPSGARDIGGRIADRAGRGEQIIIYVQSSDSYDPRYQDKIVQTIKAASRRDTSVDIRPWDGRR